mmetsp:Transcript_17185/g.37598  ORF Transcript_17185/g.37598 Transcript_17185/m.37598 type:complete len:205 (-) Transcript_17185:939-1553(-)
MLQLLISNCASFVLPQRELSMLSSANWCAKSSSSCFVGTICSFFTSASFDFFSSEESLLSLPFESIRTALLKFPTAPTSSSISSTFESMADIVLSELVGVVLAVVSVFVHFISPNSVAIISTSISLAFDDPTESVLIDTGTKTTLESSYCWLTPFLIDSLFSDLASGRSVWFLSLYPLGLANFFSFNVTAMSSIDFKCGSIDKT